LITADKKEDFIDSYDTKNRMCIFLLFFAKISYNIKAVLALWFHYKKQIAQIPFIIFLHAEDFHIGSPCVMT